MNSKTILCLVAAMSVLVLASCSGLHSGGGGGTGTAHVTITMYDTPPTGVTLLSFTLPIAGITLTPSSGSAVPLTPLVSSVEATRLQTDSVLLVDNAEVATGKYTVSVTFGATSSSSNVFINESTSAITYTLNGSSTTCAIGAVCYLPAGAVATITPSGTITLSSNQNQWIGLNLNLSNAITTTNGLTVDFTQSGVLTTTTTVRSGLPSGAADTFEDFTGKVTALTASSITVQNGLSGQSLTAGLNSSTEYDTTLASGNTYTNCAAATAQSCLALGSTVSIDVSISSSGTLTATEVDVLDAAAVDEIEGTIYATSNGTSCPSGTCFGLILADKWSQSGNAILGASTTTYGTPIYLNVGTVSNFAVDGKNLASQLNGVNSLFGTAGQLVTGQQIRAQISSMTSSNGKISATAKNLLLRFSRLSGTVSSSNSSTLGFTPPTYITTLNTQLGVAPYTAFLFTNTYYDGVATGTVVPSGTAAIRALMFDSVSPTFAVAKARVP